MVKPKQAPKYGPCSEKQKIYLQEEGVDLLLGGGSAGSGKSFLTLLKILKYVSDPAARVVVVRDTIPLLKVSGGLLDEASRIFPDFGGRLNRQDMKYTFPSGATVKFAPMPVDVEEWKGLQATHIFIDEADSNPLEKIVFLFSRLRSASFKGKRYINLTFNPNPDSFLMQFVEFCLEGDLGIPRQGTENIVRYWAMGGTKLYLADTEEELRQKLKDAGQKHDGLVMTYKFIPMNIFDNPVLIKNDPAYLANLENMSRVNRARFLLGAWRARPEGEGYFRREWCDIVPFPPDVVTARARAWDLAASVPTETANNPDWTAGVKMSRDRFGIYYVEDVVRFRKQTDGVIKDIIATAEDDGEDCQVYIPRDPSGSGKVAAAFFVRTLAESGIAAKTDVQSGHKSKLKSFLPLCSLAESGSLKIVKGDWNQDFFEELEGFTSDPKKQRLRKDDQVDAASSAFNNICKRVVIPDVFIPSLTQASPIPTI